VVEISGGVYNSMDFNYLIADFVENQIRVENQYPVFIFL